MADYVPNMCPFFLKPPLGLPTGSPVYISSDSRTDLKPSWRIGTPKVLAVSCQVEKPVEEKMEYSVKVSGLPRLFIKIHESVSEYFNIELCGMKIIPRNHEDLCLSLKDGEIPCLNTTDLGIEFSFVMNEDFTFVFWADGTTKCRLSYNELSNSILIKRY